MCFFTSDLGHLEAGFILDLAFFMEIRMHFGSTIAKKHPDISKIGKKPKNRGVDPLLDYFFFGGVKNRVNFLTCFFQFLKKWSFLSFGQILSSRDVPILTMTSFLGKWQKGSKKGGPFLGPPKKSDFTTFTKVSNLQKITFLRFLRFLICALFLEKGCVLSTGFQTV